ncbi:uncharacterized protein A1O5_12273 [Cladophialophora psammophila CBS 110553]|uniref:Telomere-associated protein Rif1 N-terminal domain-containing protein n=1 Tax=Cladophialophora psammophila CBS 110553 TaxID=1182543 RepID=W9VUK5_9EURO|nr:uncharacterized protein A1O5_12273 [Cladophialophora psammophila CBS 110553]EXJ59392.1 hypothetical protein A1O5_12273 [Cladophialophora psammophila CBS 110553]
MSIPDVLPLSPPSTSSRRKISLPNASTNATSTPDSAASFPGSSNTATRKRVGFSISTHAQELSSSQPPSSTTRPLPSVSGSQSALKSILKPCPVDGHTLQTDGSQEVKRSMSEMMESIVQQLSRDDRSLSVDAYQTLSAVIREYDDIPEEDVLKAKINTIMKYIKRDLQKQPNPDEPPIADTNLVTQALKVLVIFAWNRDYSSLLTDEYRIFILDRSIQVIAEHAAPKGVIIHYLHLLATQNFRPVLVNNNRVTRLLEALKALTEHVKGNGVVSERLLVYQKLLDQARPTMKARANLWVEELLTGMTNSLKDVRTKAITMGLKACSVFPTSSSISVTFRTILEKELTPGKTFSLAMCRRLEKMIAVKEEGIQVPQIWTIILMLSNGVEDRDPNGPWPRFDKWPQFMDWLKVIQTCFNCSELAIKQQAYMAWDRFIHIIQPHQTSDTLMALLAKPLTAQMERQSIEQTTKGTRPTAVSTYCTLLYYAFRPAATHKQYTRVWNEYIVKVMKSSFFEKSTANADLACRIFKALFWNSKKSTKVWNEKRALENTRVEPEELPTIDCKWIRAKSEAILDMFRVLVRHSSWGASGQSQRAFIAIAWSHFLRALREASSKEIILSHETVDAIINVTNWLGDEFLLQKRSRPDAADQADNAHRLSYAQVRRLTLVVITELGNDLIKPGLDYTIHPSHINKMLVIYDTLDSIIPELKHDEQDSYTSEALKVESRLLLCNCQELLDFLNALLLRDFRTVQAREPGAENSMVVFGMRQLVENDIGCFPPGYNVLLMRMLQPTLCALFSDCGERSSPDWELVTTTMNALTKVPPGSIEELDGIFAAPFESARALVREDAVTIWNKQFSHLCSVTIGSRLSKVLLTLRKEGVDVHIPGDLQPARELMPAEIPIPSGPGEAITLISRHTSLSPNKAAHDTGPSSELGSEHFGNVAAGRPDPVFSSPRRRISRPRSRHDDSQIHFVPIDSSPARRPDPDSQSLTEHQMEVRNRQRSEPADVFLDLRSSPRPHSKAQNQSNCGIARKAAALSERPSTPTLPTGQDHQEPEIPASPTPRARHVANQIADIDVPSSPPSMPGNRDKVEITSSPPQAVAEDGQVRIDLAMETNQLAPTEDVTGQTWAVVEEKAVNVQMDVHMQDQSTEEDMKLHPSTAIALAMDVDTELDEVGSSQVIRPRTDSDEIDMLSASQLSHDLDQHLSQVVEDEALQNLVETTSGPSAEQQEQANQQKPQVRRGRKRKSNSVRLGSKKRRRPESSSQTSSQSIATDSAMYDTPEEMSGCIVVAPLRAVQAVAASELADSASTASESAGAPKRRRGRPRRKTENVSSTTNSPRRLRANVEVIVPETSTFEKERTPERGMLAPALSDDGNPAAEDPQPNSDGDEIAAATAVEAEEEGARPGINALLQLVLDRLESAHPGDVDLRAVDDLCFQIRFQAQVMAQRHDARQ